jgi:IS66 C-terminal element
MLVDSAIPECLYMFRPHARKYSPAVRSGSIASRTLAHSESPNDESSCATRQCRARPSSPRDPDKNWLFAGSDDGGERAAPIYTLLGTAKLNDLNPESYLRYVLERIADHPINQIEELLPWNLLVKMPELRIAA